MVFPWFFCQRPGQNARQRPEPRAALGRLRPSVGRLAADGARPSRGKPRPTERTYWLVVWNMNFIFPNSWDDDPIWLIFLETCWNHQPDIRYWLIYRCFIAVLSTKISHIDVLYRCWFLTLVELFEDVSSTKVSSTKVSWVNDLGKFDHGLTVLPKPGILVSKGSYPNGRTIQVSEISRPYPIYIDVL